MDSNSVVNPCISVNLDFHPIDENRMSVFYRKTKKSYVIGKAEFNILINSDGVKSVEELSRLSGSYTADQVERLLLKFKDLGFVNDEQEVKKRQSLLKYRVGLTNGNKLFPSDSIITKILAIIIIYLSVPVFIAGLLALFAGGRGAGLGLFDSVNVVNIIVMFFMFIFAVTIHELAHAATARYKNVNVPEIGIMIYLFIPCGYTNLSFIALLKNKRDRLITLLSGVLSNLLQAGLAFLLASLIRSDFVAYYIAYYGIVNVSLSVINLMIFIKLDGYFIFQELLDESRLKEKSLAYLKALFSEKITAFKNRKLDKAEYFYNTERHNASNSLYFVFGIVSVIYLPILILSLIGGIFIYLG